MEYLKSSDHLLAEDCFLRQPEGMSVYYLAVSGNSPVLTNHFSTSNYEILEGYGALGTQNLVSGFDIADDQSYANFRIERGMPYSYSGEFTALYTIETPPFDGFITTNDKEPNDEVLSFLRRQRRASLRDRLLKGIVSDEAMTKYIGFQSLRTER